MNQPNIFIFIALDCEARSLIRFFQLKKVPFNPVFSIYTNDHIVLTITGVGKVIMAAGVAYTLALFPAIHLPILMNIGIAGAKDQELGELFLASKIIDTDSHSCFYPQLILNHLPQTSTLNTSSNIVTQYQDNCLHDMEGAGFYEIAIKFSSSELIHCLKIISDNNHSSIELINAKQVDALITDQQTQIKLLFDQLRQLKQVIPVIQPKGYEKLLSQWHFSITGQLKLKSLLCRWQILNANQAWTGLINDRCQTGKDVLRQLEKQLEILPIDL